MTMTGMDGLLRALREMPDVVVGELKQAVAVTAFSIANRMRATVATESGTLRNSISWRMTGLVGRVDIGVDAFYWHYLEFGTVKMGAKAFIRPAAELESTIFEQRLHDIARKMEQEFERRT